MEEAQERKKRFVLLLEGLLNECAGVKGKLAEQLHIKPSRLTHWLQGKIDPASLDVNAFICLAKQKKISLNSLAKLLGITFDLEQNSIEQKFKSLIEELLFNKSQAELATRLGVKRNTVSGWITSTKQVDPANINISTMAGIAFEKGWTIDRLFIYLGFKDLENAEDLKFQIKSVANNLSLAEQIDLLAWFSNEVGKTVKDSMFIMGEIQRENKITITIVLEKDNMVIATNYASNLAVYLKLQPNNIQVTNLYSLSSSLSDRDILIFDICSLDSPSFSVIETIDFNGYIIVFVPPNLPEEVVANISSRVTEILIKPIDWSSLKDKQYFM